jgi:hypothetical protein
MLLGPSSVDVVCFINMEALDEFSEFWVLEKSSHVRKMTLV